MRVVLRLCVALLLASLAVMAVVLYYMAWPNLPAYTRPERVQYLPQWSDTDRQIYYSTPQGTQVKGLRYQWFTALEQPFSAAPFALQANLGRFGFVFDNPSNVANTERLPVGFTQHINAADGQRYLDITCAACHTGELRYQGTALRIDGGAAQHVLPSTVPTLRGGSFGQALVASLAATAYVPWKFDRFARKVLGEHYPAGKHELRNALRSSLYAFLRAAWNEDRKSVV